MNDKQSARAAWLKSIRYSTVGIEIALAIGGGFMLGQWLDKKYGTSFWATTLLIVGFGVSIVSIVRVARQIELDAKREAEQEDAE